VLIVCRNGLLVSSGDYSPNAPNAPNAANPLVNLPTNLLPTVYNKVFDRTPIISTWVLIALIVLIF